MRIEARGELASARLDTIHVKLKSVHWVEFGKEVSINNRLFDVNECWRSNEELVIVGLFDDEETSVENIIRRLVNPPQSEDMRRSLMKYFSIVVDCPRLCEWQSCRPAENKSMAFISDDKIPGTAYLNPPSPPPDRVSATLSFYS